MLSLIKDRNEDIYLKETLTTVLDNLGVSHQEIANLLCSVDDKIEYLEDTNLFKFNNTEIVFDFGIEINKKITSSSIMIYLNNSLEFKTIEVHFLIDTDELIIVYYNNNFEFVNFKHKDFKMNEKRELLIIAAEQKKKIAMEAEENREKNEKKLQNDLVIKRTDDNRKIIKSLQEKLHLFQYDVRDFDYICNKFLLTNVPYDNWKIDSDRTFMLYDKTKKLSTTILRSGIVPISSKSFCEKCDIEFDDNLNIIAIEFKIKQITLGDYYIYVFKLDANFNIKDSCLIEVINKKIRSSDYSYNKFVFKDLVSILKFKLSENPYIYEVIPEVIVPSVYDFNSEDFKKRLLIAEMLLFW